MVVIAWFELTKCDKTLVPHSIISSSSPPFPHTPYPPSPQFLSTLNSQFSVNSGFNSCSPFDFWLGSSSKSRFKPILGSPSREESQGSDDNPSYYPALRFFLRHDCRSTSRFLGLTFSAHDAPEFRGGFVVVDSVEIRTPRLVVPDPRGTPDLGLYHCAILIVSRKIRLHLNILRKLLAL